MADDHGDHGHGHGHEAPEHDATLARIEALSNERVHHAGDHEGPFSLHVLGLGPTGVYIAVPVSFTALTLWTGLLFKRGKWKQQKL